MDQQFVWLTFRLGDNYTLSPYLAESRKQALRYGMEHVLDQELAGVFRDELGFTEEQMLELAEVLPPPTTLILSPSQRWLHSQPYLLPLVISRCGSGHQSGLTRAPAS